MVGRKRGAIPATLARGRDRFEAWRRTCHVEARIPEKLWSQADAGAVRIDVPQQLYLLHFVIIACSIRSPANDDLVTGFSPLIASVNGHLAYLADAIHHDYPVRRE